MPIEHADLSLLGNREENQDRVAIAIDDGAAFLAVVDGMGGHADGARAAEVAIRTMVGEFWDASRPLFDPDGFLHLTVGRAHEAVVALGRGLPPEIRPRATCAACIVQGPNAYWVHVGDSRVYLLRGGQVVERTRDHSHVELLLRAGRITELQAHDHPMRNYVECCIGGDPALPEMSLGGRRPLLSGDVLLLCSDGLWSGLQGRADRLARPDRRPQPARQSCRPRRARSAGRRAVCRQHHCRSRPLARRLNARPGDPHVRPSGRAADEMRTIRITRGFTRHAEGSVLVEFGETRVLVTATVEDGVPSFLRGKGEGWVTAEYGMLPRATHTRSAREAARGKQSGRTLEIQRLIGRSLRAVVDMRALGERTVTLDCDVLQADGGTRTASITGAYVALADAMDTLVRRRSMASSPLHGQVAAVSVGIVDGAPVVDLDYVEDSSAETDMNVVMNNGGGFIEVQGTAEGHAFRRHELDELLNLAAASCQQLFAAQTEALASPAPERLGRPKR